MTAPEREQQILAMLDVLTLYPADMVKLVDFVNAKDTPTGQGISLPAPIFKDQE